MNTKNNKRRQGTRERIEKEFVELLMGKEISQITVSDLCKWAEINRSTFYANYLDVYDLADQIRDRLEREVYGLYENDIVMTGNDYLKLFHHIQDNQDIYRTYFKLGYDSRHMIDLGSVQEMQKHVPEAHLVYHIEFHKAGLNAIIKKWLADGCRETPEDMVRIIQDEYTGRQ